MDARHRYRILTRSLLLAGGLAAAAGLAPVAAQGGPAAVPADSLPPGVTQAMVTKGRQVFTGAGLCIACHGMEGKGGIGPDLTDAKWLHGKGDFAEIVSRIMQGVSSDSSQSGQIMPPRGGGGIDDAQVRAVAAYVWSLSHRSTGK